MSKNVKASPRRVSWAGCAVWLCVGLLMVCGWQRETPGERATEPEDGFAVLDRLDRDLPGDQARDRIVMHPFALFVGDGLGRSSGFNGIDDVVVDRTSVGFSAPGGTYIKMPKPRDDEDEKDRSLFGLTEGDEEEEDDTIKLFADDKMSDSNGQWGWLADSVSKMERRQSRVAKDRMAFESQQQIQNAGSETRWNLGGVDGRGFDSFSRRMEGLDDTRRAPLGGDGYPRRGVGGRDLFE